MQCGIHRVDIEYTHNRLYLLLEPPHDICFIVVLLAGFILITLVIKQRHIKIY